MTNKSWATITTMGELAAEIAREIREKGHYQSRPGQDMQRQCCLLANSAWERATISPYGAFERLMGISTGITEFNDQTPTEVILDRLDKIASGEIHE